MEDVAKIKRTIKAISESHFFPDYVPIIRLKILDSWDYMYILFSGFSGVSKNTKNRNVSDTNMQKTRKSGIKINVSSK